MRSSSTSSLLIESEGCLLQIRMLEKNEFLAKEIAIY